MLYLQKIADHGILSNAEIKEAVFGTCKKLGIKKKVIAVPPDITRFHSFAGPITEFVYEFYGKALTDILPAIGTHYPMTKDEIALMYPTIPQSLFRIHNWRTDLNTLGIVPSDFVKTVSDGKVNYSIPIQVNKMMVEGKYDLILSIGQVVPHEVIGMANFNKNIFIGTGGKEGINKSHFLGAAYGMEKIMGRADSPVRRVLNYGSENFADDLPIVYVLTVVGKDEEGKLGVKGLFIGDDYETFNLAADLSLKENFILLDKPLKKVVVYLDPSEFRTTWLGNKSIYRTRMAIDDDGELIIIAPGVAKFGEDPGNDKMIRKYGYFGTEKVLKLIEENEDLQNSLGAAAHLIHGSSEGRFKITYAPGFLTKEEVINVNYNFADIEETIKKYDPAKLKDGINNVNGEEIFYISNPALGLWAFKERF